MALSHCALCGRPLSTGFNTWCEVCCALPRDAHGVPIRDDNPGEFMMATSPDGVGVQVRASAHRGEGAARPTTESVASALRSALLRHGRVTRFVANASLARRCFDTRVLGASPQEVT